MTTERKEIVLGDYFSDTQLKLAAQCKNATEICDRVVTPHLAEINRISGQANDPKYWAYMLEYALMQQRH